MRKTTAQLLFVLASSLVFLDGCNGCNQQQTNTFIDQAIPSFYGQPVKVPLRDTTPPIASLKVPDIGAGPITLTTGQQSVTIPINANQSPFFVLGVADDPEGVKEVDLLGGGTINCSNGQGIGSTTSVDFPNGVAASDASPAKPGGNATTRRTVIFQVDHDQWTVCPDSNFHLVSATLTLQASGVNFSGLRSSSPLATFSFKPQ